MGEMMLARLNDGQRAAFDQIMAAINDVKDKAIVDSESH